MPNLATAAFADDGMPPDMTADDGIWTAVFIFDPGTTLEYKYTIVGDRCKDKPLDPRLWLRR